MTSQTSFEETRIEPNRIVIDQELPSEYFCPVCQCLLWKPVSCSRCQHLFCGNCLELWSRNTDGVKKCPFRCQPFEEHRCPPYFQSLLSRLQIRCRNESFGCQEILSYDALEHHESVECKFLTQTCVACQQRVLVEKILDHENTPGACIPLPIKCVICEQHFQQYVFQEHFRQCHQQRINQLWQRARWRQTYQPTTGRIVNVPNDFEALFRVGAEGLQLFEQQRRFSRLPTKLKGIDDVLESRQQQYGYLYRIYTMLRFVLLNWTKAPFLILQISGAGLIKWMMILASLLLVALTTIPSRLLSKRGVIFVLVVLLHGATYLCLQWLSDSRLMFLLVMFSIIEGCSVPLVLEQLEMNPLFNKPCFNILSCGINLLLIKLCLLLLRFYFWCLSIYALIGFSLLLTGYVYYKHVRARRPFLQIEPSFGLNVPL